MPQRTKVVLTEKPKVFSGRVIFDHLPKTAGQAINTWLVASLGGGCVTDNLIGSQRELIRRYGGVYSVISGHIGFSGEGLDPRYQYVTVLREPVDRALSWLFFVHRNHEPSQLDFWREVETFIKSEGEEGFSICSHISNQYVGHFSAIDLPPATGDAQKLDKALAAIARYEVFGFYERLAEFLADFAALLALPAPTNIARVNVTKERPAVDGISVKFRKRLEALNALDIEFYHTLRDRYEAVRRKWQRPKVEVSRWTPLGRPVARVFETEEFSLLSCSLAGGNHRTVGGVLSFVLEFSLAAEVSELELGIHVFDQDGRWAFGTNTTLLGRPLRNAAAGTYRERYVLVADLPEGDYTAGFAFAERMGDGVREIAWYDRLVSFRISRQLETKTAGYVRLSAAVNCPRIRDRIVQKVLDARGRLHSEDVLGDLAVGEALSLPVVLINESAQEWVSLPLYPINLSYRWLDQEGTVVVPESERTPLPESALPPGARVAVALTVKAPSRTGCYRLRAMPVQEGVCWFDQRGFVPLEREVTVK